MLARSTVHLIFTSGSDSLMLIRFGYASYSYSRITLLLRNGMERTATAVRNELRYFQGLKAKETLARWHSGASHLARGRSGARPFCQGAECRVQNAECGHVLESFSALVESLHMQRAETEQCSQLAMHEMIIAKVRPEITCSTFFVHLPGSSETGSECTRMSLYSTGVFARRCFFLARV